MNEPSFDLCILIEGATIRDALLSFDESQLGVALICDAQHRLVGLATEGDVRRALLAGHGLISSVLSIANRAPKIGKTSMNREELVAMLSDSVRCLPVLDDSEIPRDILLHDRRTFIPIASPAIGEKELRYVTDAVLSGWISSQGKYISLFEQEFARFCDSKYAVAVANGTVALHLALTVAGVEAGDEVIVPALTFVATASAVKHCHARPVFVDVEPDTWNMDPEQIEAAITSRTKAIIPVHLYGNPCRMDHIMEIARKHNLTVIEDAAEAHGAEFAGKRTGSIGRMGCFSFYGNKLITTGEGGAIVCQDPAVNERLRILRDHGMSPTRKYWHDSVGYNYRMTNIQAAVGVAQLERWATIIGAKERIRAFYDANLPKRGLIRSHEYPSGKSVCWLYTFCLDPSVHRIGRDELLAKLKENGVDGRPVFYPIPDMPPYYHSDCLTRFPVARRISEQGLSLPSSGDLTKEKLQRICDVVNALLA